MKDIPRWVILIGEYEKAERLAADKIYSLISSYTDYLVQIERAKDASDKLLCQNNIVVIGTERSNPIIKSLCDKNLIPLSEIEGNEGYFLSVGENFKNFEHQMITVSGNTDIALLYGVCDLINNYFANEVFRNSKYERRNPRIYSIPFSEKLPKYSKLTAPAVKRRAIWTWGHCIYDFRRFFDKMAELRLNEAVIWNDFCPINAKEIVDYAHERGISVIFGYTWGWDDNNVSNVDVSDRSTWSELADKIIDTFEKSYLCTGLDGIYFQSFTETGNRTRDGIVIAEAVTDWVNFVSERLFRKHPDLKVQFGLHATSVRNDLEIMKRTDNRLQIIWENCGAFPFCYDTNQTADFDKTISFCRKISTLRGQDDKFGVVIKGMTTLCWDDFEHHKGQYILGVEDKSEISRRAKKKSRYWRILQADWISNAKYPYELIKTLTEEKNGDLDIQLLVEDGYLEENTYFPVLFSAELLWNAKEDLESIIRRVLLSKPMNFAKFTK